MPHRYQPIKKSNQNSILVSRFSGEEYHLIQCFCGLFGVGATPCEAMNHTNWLHETKQPTLLFFNVACLNLEENYDYA